eukprot:NODE_23131_length_679_cov_2.217391.p2 GENE.NODE_23131_length_679_cov_2.217391~~NODE_23131_length_679_cov_2.217391.p2  ORF type:complete len:117 (+),score=35.32 NODE_23131_length_679_cov_2.217391:278-628(+)
MMMPPGWRRSFEECGVEFDACCGPAQRMWRNLLDNRLVEFHIGSNDGAADAAQLDRGRHVEFNACCGAAAGLSTQRCRILEAVSPPQNLKIARNVELREKKKKKKKKKKTKKQTKK